MISYLKIYSEKITGRYIEIINSDLLEIKF